MRILFIAPRFPYPLEKGDRLRVYNLIKETSKTMEVHFFCVAPKEVPPEYIIELEPYCKSICIARLNIIERFLSFCVVVLRFLPLQLAFFYTWGANRKFKRYLKEIDVDIVFSQMLRMHLYFDKKAKYIKALDLQDALSYGLFRRLKYASIFGRLLLNYEYKTMLSLETKAIEKYDIVTIISEQDRELLPLPKQVKDKIKILRNGVNIDRFSPNTSVEKIYDIVFAGNMSYPPNENAALFLVNEILPELEKKVSRSIKVLIAGTKPTNLVKALASENVHVTGYIEDMSLAYRSSKVFVAPMRIGTGMQNKVLEAMSCYMPCVVSELAARGLNNPDRVKDLPILIANTKNEEFTNAIYRLLTDTELANKLAQQSREVIEKEYAWSAQTKEVVSLFEKCLSKKGNE